MASDAVRTGADLADDALKAFLASRVQYWTQWGIEVTYSPVERDRMARIIKRHARNPAVIVAKMEKLTWKAEVDCRRQLASRTLNAAYAKEIGKAA